MTSPGPLRRYLSFARLPDPALEVAKRVLDDDDAFRTRVAAAVDEQAVGRAGWVFLTRPDGWHAEVETLRKAAAAQQLAAKEGRAERDAVRKLAGAEAAAARAEASAVAASSEAERLRAELAQERTAAQSALAQAERQAALLTQAVEERGAAIRRVKELEAGAIERSASLRALRHELRMAQAELAQTDVASSDDGGAEAPASAEPVVSFDEEGLRSAVVEARQAAHALNAALESAAELLALPGPARPDADEPPAPRAPRRAARRRPVRLPPAVLDDSLEAADHLVRAQGALLLVDGYNISHAQWHGLPLAEQRSRLLDACAELHARCGTDVEVVFDGAGDASTVGTQARATVRHRFTPAGEEADDVILARIDEEPAERPVLVASSDRRVRDGARQRGANVLGARQLLAVLRRS